MALWSHGARARSAWRQRGLGLWSDACDRLGRYSARGRSPCFAGHLHRNHGRFLGNDPDGAPGPTSEHLLAALLQAARRDALVRPGFRARGRHKRGPDSRLRGSASLVVGIRPTNYLDYSPLIVTSDARSWSPEGPIGALADEPDALAIAGGGEAMALTSDGSSTRVILSRGRLASWRQIATEQGLARSQAGHLCGPVLLTAVGYAAGQGLIGASCRRDGIIGIFTLRQGTWRLVGPRLPQSSRNSTAEVLGLQAGNGGLCALVGVTAGASAGVVVACTSGSELKWDVSPVMSIVGRQHVVSFGSAGRLGLYVLTSGSADGHLLAVSGQTETSWRRLPSPPSRTAVVVFDPAGRVDALAADDTSFTDWRLVGGDNWKRVQQVRVPIQFGSSG